MLAANRKIACTEPRAADTGSWPLGKLAMVFLLLAGLLALGGYAYLAHRQKEARREAQRDLSAIADLKLNQIRQWREERLADARFFSRARFVAQDVRQFLDDPGSESSRSAMLHWMVLLKGGERYESVTVFDAGLNRRLSVPESAGEPAAPARKLLEQALQSGYVLIGDLHRDENDGPVSLDIAFPVFEESNGEGGVPLAMVLLELNASQFLFPLIQSWPTPSRTAETLLIRQEGDSVLFLNDLRHRAGTALTLRASLATPELPAAKVVRGETNVLEGVDYRGVPVVAVGRLIPGTPWAMVAKIDREEIYAPLRRQTFAALAVLAPLLISGVLVLALLWRQRDVRFLRRELSERKIHNLEMERMNRLYAALSQVNQAVVHAASRDELLRQICEALVQLGGFKMAWVGWVDQAKQVLPLAHAGDKEGYLEQVKVYADERPEGQGPTGIAIREGRPCVCNDALDDPRMALWRETAAHSGWRSIAAFPIRQEGRIRGALAVYASQSDFFGEQEQTLVAEAAEDVSFGLDNLLKDQRRRELQARLEGVISSAMDAIISINARQQIVLFNPAAEKIFGTAAKDALGKNINVFIPERFRAAHTRHVQEFSRTGVSSRSMSHLGVLNGLRADGEEFPIEASISQTQVGDEKLLTVILRDITQRRQAEEALRQSEQRFRQLADAMPQIVWTARPDGHLDYYNRKWYELTGAKEGETGDPSWLPILHPDDRQMCLDVWYESVRTGEPYEIEYRFRFPGSGFYRWHLGRALPIRNERGEIVRWFGTSTDIDDLKRAESALTEARDRLEETVAERTAQLVEANANLQAFAYTAAHDLRSPLRSIRSFSAILMELCGAKLGEENRSMLERVLGSAEQMGRLLDDLLEYSKMSQVELKLEPVSLRMTLAEALALLDGDVKSKNAVVTVTEPLPEVIGHPATMILLINNLVSNALKFMPPNVQPQIGISAERIDNRVRLFVRDNGIGIAGADLEKIFGAFERLHAKHAYPGTGLGLAIVRTGAERMGGRVGVESKVGKGSRFWIELRSSR